MSEVINILREELKYECTSKDDKNTHSTYAEKLKVNLTQCEKCTQLESQLKLALNELSSMKLITNILNEEITALKHPSRAGYKDTNSYTSANLFNSSCPTENRPPINGYSSRGNSNDCHYTVPISNRYAALSTLSDSHQPYGSLPSLNLEQATGFLPRTNINYNERHHWNKIPAIKHSSLQSTLPLDNPNLQEQTVNVDGTSHIPTVVNGVLSVHSNIKLKQEVSDLNSDTITNHINKLSESVNVLNKVKHPAARKHRILLVGDSHIRGYASTLKPLLNNNYDLFGTVKPGSGTSELSESAKRQLINSLSMM